MNKRYIRKENEKHISYLMRLVAVKLEELPSDLEWDEIVKLCDLKNSKNNHVHYDTLRKVMQPSEFGAYAIYKYMLDNAIESDEILNQMEQKQLEIKKETQKLRDLRSGQNEVIRNQSRKESILEEVREYTSNLIPVIPPKTREIARGNISAILGIADAHYGEELSIEGLKGDIINLYNPEIFEERMWELFNEYVDLIKFEKISKIKFFDLSDSVVGMLRISGLQHIKYGLVESSIKYAHFMAAWLNALSKYVDIDYYSCLGNHCETRPFASRSSDFAKENMQYVIDDIIKTELSKNKSVKINDVKALQYVECDDIKILATHGQEEKNLVDSVLRYKEIYDVKFDLMISGHLHNSKQETASLHTKIIQFPSIMGSNVYSMKLKRTAKAEAKAILIKGKKFYNIDIEL